MSSPPPPPPYHAYEPFPLPPDEDSIQQLSGELVVRDKAKKKRRIGAVLMNSLEIIVVLVVTVIGLASLATFAAKENEIRSKTVYDDVDNGSCVLFAKYSSNQLSLGRNNACSFVTYGEAFACFFAAAVSLFAGVRIWMGKWCDADSTYGGFGMYQSVDITFPAGSRVR